MKQSKRCAIAVAFFLLGSFLTSADASGNKKAAFLSELESEYSVQQSSIKVKGTVLDQNGEVLIGATIRLKSESGNATGTITDFDGNFEISVPNENAVLLISNIGYKSKEIKVGKQTVLKVQLEEDTQQLDDVVVVGYGSQRKSDLTGGISSISSEKFSKISAPTLGQKLQGQIAGLNVNVGNARPGADATFKVRGETSLSGSSAPLIILDGIPFNGSMNEIDHNSIDNVSVLKDASSATIYGSRAANGVILITTKKGKVGKPIVRYNGYVGVQQAEWLPNLMKGAEYMQLLKDYKRAVNNADWQTPEKWLNAGLQDNYKNGVETDWLAETFRSALQQEHQLSLSGATDNNSYYVSLGYTNQDGIVKYTGYKKYSITSNMTQKVGDWLNLGLNLQLLQRDRGGYTPHFAYANRMSPYASVRNEDGTFKRYPMEPETMYYSPYANYGAIYDNISNGAYISSFAEVKLPVKGLTYRANLGYSYRHRSAGSYYGTSTMSGEPVGGTAGVEDYDYGDWTAENILRYENDFGKHHIDFTGLYSAQSTYYTEHVSSGKGFLSDNNSYHDLGAANDDKKIGSRKSETSMLSQMGRINYSYDKRYLLTLTARRDGFSAFGEGKNKWGLFPSVAAAWVLSEESFFGGIKDYVDFLKLRLSYGANGNLAVSAYQTKLKLEKRNYIYGNEAKFARGLVAGHTYGNEQLKWETTYSFNGGLDFSVIDNRISGSVDAYFSDTHDLLMDRKVPIMNGYMSMRDNIGKTKNYGVDINLNTVNFKNSDFQWASTFVLSGNWNKITELNNPDEEFPKGKDDIGSGWFLDQPIRVLYGYKTSGIWQKDETEQMAAAKYWNNTPKAGDVKIVDANNDGVIDAKDRMVIGRKSPTWIVGLTNTFSYKNWMLSVFINGSFGAWKQNETVKFERQLFDKNVNYISGINYWTEDNPSNEYPRLDYMIKAVDFYTKADFVRIQDLNLSYQVPSSIVNKLGVSALSTYINVRNLYTFSSAKKFTTNIEHRTDRGVETYSLDAAGYPSQRVFTLGLNLTF